MFGLASQRRRLRWCVDKASIVSVVAQICEGLVFGGSASRRGDRPRGRNGCYRWNCRRIQSRVLSCKRLSQCCRRSKCACAKLPKTSRCSICTSKSSTDSFDVLLPLFVVEVLDAPFYTFKVSFLSNLQDNPWVFTRHSFSLELLGELHDSCSQPNNKRTINLQHLKFG